MARENIFLGALDGDEAPKGESAESKLAILKRYTQGVSPDRIVDGKAVPDRSFAQRQAILASWLRKFKGNEQAAQFLKNMGEGLRQLPRPGGQGIEMIVIHYTATKTKTPALNTFESATATDPKTGGKTINVGAHFLIDENGKILQLAPIEQIVMHAKCFNLQSIGVEIAARSPGEITQAQLDSVVALCEDLMRKCPQIKYIAGHHELTDKSKPYAKFYARSGGGGYPEGKVDPGDDVMERIRVKLRGSGFVPITRLSPIPAHSVEACR
ncbi:MAG: N-acetylmuramoyl-L-alanine amidase [Candidatus Micrarchaeia archaeon]|jgi:hypothetical protein